MPVTEGTTLQVQQSSIETDGVGGNVAFRYQGTRAELENLVAVLGLATNGHKYSLNPTEGPFAELVWTIASGPDGSATETDETISTDWEFDTPSAMVPLSEHPDWVSQIASLMSGDVLLHSVFMSVWADESAYEDIGEAALSTLQSSYNFLYEALQMKREGVTGYYRGEPILTVVDRYQRQATFTLPTANVNLVYSRSSLIAGLIGRSVNPMPAYIQSALAEGEYLAEQITRRASSDGSREVTQVFRYAPRWRDILYDHV